MWDLTAAVLLSNPERRLPGGRRPRCRAPAAPAPPHSCYSGVWRFSCRACLLPALCSLLSSFSFFPRRLDASLASSSVPPAASTACIPEAPVAWMTTRWRRSGPGFQKLISLTGHDLGPEQNTPHTRLCLWKPLQLGGSVSFVDSPSSPNSF